MPAAQAPTASWDEPLQRLLATGVLSGFALLDHRGGGCLATGGALAELAEPGAPAASQLHAAFHAAEAPPHIDVCGQQAVLVQRSDSSVYAVSRGKALGITAHYLPAGILATAFSKPSTLQSVAPQLEAICDRLRRP